MITFPREDRLGFKTLDNPQVARRFAERFGCEHHEIVVKPDVVELLPKLLWHMDEPTADPAIIAAYLVCHAARKSTTVLLSGVGGDELFAGYRKHVAHRLAQRYQMLPHVLRRGFSSRSCGIYRSPVGGCAIPSGLPRKWAAALPSTRAGHF